MGNGAHQIYLKDALKRAPKNLRSQVEKFYKLLAKLYELKRFATATFFSDASRRAAAPALTYVHTPMTPAAACGSI